MRANRQANVGPYVWAVEATRADGSTRLLSAWADEGEARQAMASMARLQPPSRPCVYSVVRVAPSTGQGSGWRLA